MNTTKRPEKRPENSLTKEERDKLVLDHMKYVEITTNAVCKRPDMWEDCYAEGELGLVLASRYFNPDLGVKFRTFAINEMKYRMYDFLYNNKPVRLPEDYRGKLGSFRSVVDDLQQDRQEVEISPSLLIEAAEACGLNTAVLQVELNPATSLDKPASAEDDSFTIKELLRDNTTPEEVLETLSISQTVEFIREYAEKIKSSNDEFTKWFRIHINNICDELEGKIDKTERPAMLDLIRADYPQWTENNEKTDMSMSAKDRAHYLDNKYCAFNDMWRNALRTRLRPILVARGMISR